jgi:hypothetical protein
MHGPHQPAWTNYRLYLQFIARCNFLLQTGTLRIDVAFWQKKTDYAGHTTARTYVPDDLELAGKSKVLPTRRIGLPEADS